MRKYDEKILDILQILRFTPDNQLMTKLEDYYENDIALAFEELDDDEVKHLIQVLPADFISRILPEVEDSEDIVEYLNVKKIAAILEEMEPNDAHILFDGLSDTKKEALKKLMSPELKSELLMLSKYEEGEVGYYMNTNFALLDDTHTITSAMRKVIEFASSIEDFATLYINNSEGKYRGTILLRDLILARKNDSFADLIKENYPFIYDTDSMEEASLKTQDYELDNVPVLNHEGKIIGVLTDDILKDFTIEDLQEEFHNLAGIKSESVGEGLFKSVFMRLPWLIGLLVVAIIVSMTSSSFEAIIAPLVTIVFFQSMIADMAGNVGTQSLAVTISKDFDTNSPKKEKRKTIWSETLTGLINGVILGAVAFLVVSISLLIMGKQAELLRTALTVSISMIFVSTISSFLGAFVPILLMHLHIDPAVASGPAITTVNDIVAVLVYFGLAYLIFYII